MSSPRSRRSADSTSGLNALVCASCSKPKLTSGDGASSNGIGPTCGCSMTFVLFDPSRTLQADGTVTETWMEHDVANALLKPSGTKSPLLASVPTSSRAVSRAKISASPADAEDSPGNDPACSSSSHGSQMSFDPDGSSSRTSWDCSPHKTAGTSEPFFTRWPTSGTASAGGFSTLVSSEFPSGAVECSLSDVLETMVDGRYALSPRAARGILRRADARGRALPDALLAALTELGEAA